MAIANTIPGFQGLTSDASNLIKSLMSGNLSGSTRRAIFDAGAERGTASGMPGSTGIAGSLFANNDLRNIGATSAANQQRGFQDLLAMITGYSGTVTPTTGQEQEQNQFNTSMSYKVYQDEMARRERQQAAQDAFASRVKPFKNLKSASRGVIRAGGRGDSDGTYDYTNI